MKTKSQLLALLSVTIIACGLPSAIAATADDGTIAVAPASPSENTEASGKRDGKRMQGMLDQRLEDLDKNLQLTGDQKEQIKAIWAKDVAAAKGAQGKDRRAAMMESRKEIRAVLTPDQQAKFDKMGARAGGAAGKAKKAK